mgnify:CR=1 FL=1|jgi:KDO2-lipid IV(A) lauroyltransferase
MKYQVIKSSLLILKGLSKYFPMLFEFLQPVFKFMVKNLVGYRKCVIKDNLKNSFCEVYTEDDRNQIVDKYYSVMFRYIKETIMMLSFDQKMLKSKIIYHDQDRWEGYFLNQRSVIVTASHYGNWEVNLVAFPALTRMKVVAFYKPMSGSDVDKIMFDARSKFGLLLYPIQLTARVMQELKMEKVLYIFLGDQSPLNMNGVYWNSFLNQCTPWLTGAEKLAKKYHYPVVYLSQKPIIASDVWYKLEFQLISDHSADTEVGEITEKYSRILEAEIKQNPEYWLWSHNRWKRADHKYLAGNSSFD